MTTMTNEPIPINSTVVVGYTIEHVKKSIEELLRAYPQYFVVPKLGVNHELGTYVFSRPKGIDTPMIRLTVTQIEDSKTKIDINCSSCSITVTPPDLQIAITELYNILMAKLKGNGKEQLEYIIKQNNSGNGVYGCLKTIGCTGLIGMILLIFFASIALAIIGFILSLF